MKNKTITGFTCGAFDLLHAGHLLALKEIAEQCDWVFVGLQTDPSIDRPDKQQPVESVEERKLRLESCRYVDAVFVYETEAELYDLLRKLSETYSNFVRFLGADWKGKKFTGHDLPIKVIFNSRDHEYSSTNLRNRIASSL